MLINSKVALALALATTPLVAGRLGTTRPKKNAPPAKKHLDGKKNHPAPRIIGGEDAQPDEFPFYTQFGGCGGSLIHPDIVLTAAHCSGFYDTVDVGAYEADAGLGEVRSIVQGRLHPSFNYTTMAYDFALLKLSEPVTTIQPVPLNRDSTNPAAGDTLTAIGLGSLLESGFFPLHLMKVDVPAIADDVCNDYYSPINGIVDDVMMCAGLPEGGKDACIGDSGGPLVDATGTQVGITSWGIGCAQPGFPGVYAEVSSVQDWINDMICQLSSDPPEGCPPVSEGGAVSLTFQFDDFPSEVGWSFEDADGTVVDSRLPGTYFLPNGTVQELIDLQPGSTYNFTITDTAYDGICCLYGNGHYEVKAGEVVLASGGNYTSSESTTVVVPV